MINSCRSVSITTFVGREKCGNHLWSHQQVDFPAYFSMFFYNIINFLFVGDWTITEISIYNNVQLLAALSDNEGIIFITHNVNSFDDEREDVIRFHRIYRNNWFFLGRYHFLRHKKRDPFIFSKVFMFQGNFFFCQEKVVKKCRQGSYLQGGTFICFEEIFLPPKIHLLDRATDKFIEQKIDINYKNFEFFSITV